MSASASISPAPRPNRKIVLIAIVALVIAIAAVFMVRRYRSHPASAVERPARDVQHSMAQGDTRFLLHLHSAQESNTARSRSERWFHASRSSAPSRSTQGSSPQWAHEIEDSYAV